MFGIRYVDTLYSFNCNDSQMEVALFSRSDTYNGMLNCIRKVKLPNDNVFLTPHNERQIN